MEKMDVGFTLQNALFRKLLRFHNFTIVYEIIILIKIGKKKKEFDALTRYEIFVSGEMIISNHKYSMSETKTSVYSVQMRLVIMNLQKQDLGGYKCISKNSIGDAEGNIRLYGEFSWIMRLWGSQLESFRTFSTSTYPREFFYFATTRCKNVVYSRARTVFYVIGVQFRENVSKKKKKISYTKYLDK